MVRACETKQVLARDAPGVLRKLQPQSLSVDRFTGSEPNRRHSKPPGARPAERIPPRGRSDSGQPLTPRTRCGTNARGVFTTGRSTVEAFPQHLRDTASLYHRAPRLLSRGCRRSQLRLRRRRARVRDLVQQELRRRPHGRRHRTHPPQRRVLVLLVRPDRPRLRQGHAGGWQLQDEAGQHDGHRHRPGLSLRPGLRGRGALRLDLGQGHLGRLGRGRQVPPARRCAGRYADRRGTRRAGHLLQGLQERVSLVGEWADGRRQLDTRQRPARRPAPAGPTTATARGPGRT